MCQTHLLQKYGPWAVVTGASSGIGAEFAQQLGAQGFHIVLIARRLERLRAIADDIEKKYDRSTVVIQADLTESGAIERIAEMTEMLEVGFLVNNAGIALWGPFVSQSEEEIHALIQLNIGAVTSLARLFGRKMCERKKGGIMFVSSLASSGVPYTSVYSASKAFVSSLAATLNEEFRPFNVKCMALEPGFVKSEFTAVHQTGFTSSLGGDKIMDTDVCVRKALRVFGRKPLFTPGLRGKLIKFFNWILPKGFYLWTLGMAIRKANEGFDRL
ncbi:Short-chain dehydrogenase/reductase family protein [Gracilaria domingensis]|nr:Short-chain dehydrogenase/reductase family protein [Gracilaria domingensis]